MRKYENLGFTSVVTNDKIKIELPIKNLVTAFEYSPENNGEIKIKRGCRNKLADFVAKHIIQECDQETGETYIINAIDHVFELILEGYEYSDDFIVERKEEFK